MERIVATAAMQHPRCRVCVLYQVYWNGPSRWISLSRTRSHNNGKDSVMTRYTDTSIVHMSHDNAITFSPARAPSAAARKYSEFSRSIIDTDRDVGLYTINNTSDPLPLIQHCCNHEAQSPSSLWARKEAAPLITLLC